MRKILMALGMLGAMGAVTPVKANTVYSCQGCFHVDYGEGTTTIRNTELHPAVVEPLARMYGWPGDYRNIVWDIEEDAITLVDLGARFSETQWKRIVDCGWSIDTVFWDQYGT